MIVTTTPTIEGHTIKEYKGLVSGEVIFGMNFLNDFGASLRDFFGGRTDSYEKAMLEGRETAQIDQRVHELLTMYLFVTANSVGDLEIAGII